jgi:cell division protein FtsL
MAVSPKTSKNKRLLIDKANATMLIFIGVAAFLLVFAIFSAKALLSQSSYQSKVIKEKQKAFKQLQINTKNVDSLVASYGSFASESQNVLGGNPTGSGPRDGDNPRIVLDALPSKYDYPGLISSIEKVLKEGGYKIESYGGSDDEINQQNAKVDKPTPIEMPFPITVNTSFEGAQLFLTTLERSIRPIYVNKLTLTAAQGKIVVSISAKTYYQPEKVLKITKKVVK